MKDMFGRVLHEGDVLAKAVALGSSGHGIKLCWVVEAETLLRVQFVVRDYHWNREKRGYDCSPWYVEETVSYLRLPERVFITGITDLDALISRINQDDGALTCPNK